MIAIPRFHGLAPEDVAFAEQTLVQLDALERQAAVMAALCRQLKVNRERLEGELWAWKLRERIEVDLEESAATLRQLERQMQDVELSLHRLAWDSEKVRIPRPNDGTAPARSNGRLA